MATFKKLSSLLFWRTYTLGRFISHVCHDAWYTLVFGQYYFINQIRMSVSVFPYWSLVTEKSMGKNPTECRKASEMYKLWAVLVLAFFLVWASLDPSGKHVHCTHVGFFNALIFAALAVYCPITVSYHLSIFPVHVATCTTWGGAERGGCGEHDVQHRGQQQESKMPCFLFLWSPDAHSSRSRF